MKKLKHFFILILAITSVISCNQVTYKKTPGGMPYQLFPGNGGKTIKPGNTIKLNLIQKIKDSVYFTSYDKMPVYTRVMDKALPYDLSELWTRMKPGDSAVVTQMMDTFINRRPGSVPQQFKKGDRIVTYIKMLNVFESDSAYNADNEKEKDIILKSEVASMDKYIADKKINAQKTPSGVYVEIIKPGEGNLIDSGKYVSVKYRGTSFSGKIFDSNIDTAFHKTEPLAFTVGRDPMIKGFTEGIKLLKNGSVAKFYIPSLLGYGPQPPSPDIKPFEALMFDITVIDVKDKAPESVPQNNPMQKINPHMKNK